MTRFLALAFVVVTHRPAAACDCPAFDDKEATAKATAVFDGWVIDAPDPWQCPQPPAPRAKPGCVRIAVVDIANCKPHGDLLGLRAEDGSAVNITSVDDDATTFCGIKAGKYIVARETWSGDENGTIDHGRTLDVVPGGSYVVFRAAQVGQRLRVGVARTLKGSVAREITVTTKQGCGTPFAEVGEAFRFFGVPGEGGVVVSGCYAMRRLTDAERVQAVSQPAPPAEPATKPATPPRHAKERTGSCSTNAPSLWLALVCILFVRTSRRRRSTPARCRRSFACSRSPSDRTCRCPSTAQRPS